MRRSEHGRGWRAGAAPAADHQARVVEQERHVDHEGAGHERRERREARGAAHEQQREHHDDVVEHEVGADLGVRDLGAEFEERGDGLDRELGARGDERGRERGQREDRGQVREQHRPSVAVALGRVGRRV